MTAFAVQSTILNRAEHLMFYSDATEFILTPTGEAPKRGFLVGGIGGGVTLENDREAFELALTDLLSGLSGGSMDVVVVGRVARFSDVIHLDVFEYFEHKQDALSTALFSGQAEIYDIQNKRNILTEES